MPINSCSNNGKPGYKWGDQGMCYTYTEGNDQSMKQAKNKARLQGIAARLNGYKEKANEVTTGTMGSGIKNPQQGYKPKKKKKKENFGKSLDRWFSERWVDISRPKKGGGFEPCGRADAKSGKYPKCVPAARAARMTPAQIASAVRRKRRAESTQTRQDKKPINVSTDVEKASRNVPTNPELYARVKAEAKRKFDVYPSAYANAWLVREYKKRGGGYRTVSKSEEIVFNKVADDLDEQEAVLADMLIAVTRIYGKFNEDETGVWAGYDSPENNDVADIGVKCSNCVMYEGKGVCKIISQMVEPEGKCRFAIIPDGVVEVKNDEEEDEEDEMQDKAMMEEMPESNEEGEEEEEGEEDDDELDLKPRQKMHYEVLESIAEQYGKWDQTSGANGAHYAPASENPFKKQGMICANCVFYEGGRGCEIVSGTIEPEAICKLWIIDESLISESK